MVSWGSSRTGTNRYQPVPNDVRCVTGIGTRYLPSLRRREVPVVPVHRGPGIGVVSVPVPLEELVPVLTKRRMMACFGDVATVRGEA